MLSKKTHLLPTIICSVAMSALAFSNAAVAAGAPHTNPTVPHCPPVCNPLLGTEENVTVNVAPGGPGEDGIVLSAACAKDGLSPCNVNCYAIQETTGPQFTYKVYFVPANSCTTL
jgi:hypothetical protein